MLDASAKLHIPAEKVANTVETKTHVANSGNRMVRILRPTPFVLPPHDEAGNSVYDGEEAPNNIFIIV